MPKIPGLVRRGRKYYFRIRVPKELVPSVGRREINESLKTEVFEEAKKLRNARALFWDARFERLMANLEGLDTIQPPVAKLNKNEAIRLVQDYILKCDEDWQKGFATDGPDTVDQQAELVLDTQLTLQSLRDPADPNAQRDVYLTSKDILPDGQTTLGEGGVTYGEFAEFVRRGLIELHRRQVCRLKGEHTKSFFDHMFDPDQVVKPAPSDLTVKEIGTTISG